MISAATLFCEDIRQELAGSVTIIGVLPDNIGMESTGGLPRLGIYTRIIVPTDDDPREMRVLLRKPDGGEDVLGEFSAEFVATSAGRARERGNSIAGFVSTAIAAPFLVTTFGRFYSVLRVGSEDVITGSINFELSADAGKTKPA